MRIHFDDFYFDCTTLNNYWWWSRIYGSVSDKKVRTTGDKRKVNLVTRYLT